MPLGFNVQKFYNSGLVLWDGDRKMKKTLRGPRYKVKPRVKKCKEACRSKVPVAQLRFKGGPFES